MHVSTLKHNADTSLQGGGSLYFKFSSEMEQTWGKLKLLHTDDSEAEMKKK
jgi:hypothetical protein